MSLINLISDLHRQVERLHVAKISADEVKSLQQRKLEISTLAKELHNQVQLIAVFESAGFETLEMPSSVNDTLKRVQKIKDAFEQSGDPSSLTEGKDWVRILTSLEDIPKHIKENLTNSWSQFITQNYSGDKPENLKIDLAATQKNTEVHRRYQLGDKEYADLAGIMPRSPADFQQMKDKGVTLSNIHKEFDFDVPDDVKVFLKAIGENGADLGLLTKNVLSWLQENNTEINYKIIRKFNR